MAIEIRKDLYYTHAMDILIVEDHKPTRNRLVSLLEGLEGYRVRGAVDCAEKALECAESTPPDMIILDLGLPGLSGVEAIRALKKTCPGAEILVFTVMEDDDQVFASLRAGASGYLLKDAEPSQIVASIEELRSGGAPMSFPIARKVLKEFRDMGEGDGMGELFSPLSPREAEVLEHLYRGDSYKEIADKLKASVHTVHTHIKNIYAKLHVNSRSQAIYEACRKRLIRM